MGVAGVFRCVDVIEFDRRGFFDGVDDDVGRGRDAIVA